MVKGIEQQASKYIRQIRKSVGKKSNRKNLSKKETNKVRDAKYRKQKIMQIDKYLKIEKGQVYGDPLYDTNFNKCYPDIVSSFLSSMSNTNIFNSKTLQQLDPSLFMNLLYDISAKVGLLYESGDNLFVVEVQTKKFKPYGKRLQHYASKSSFIIVMNGDYNYYNYEGNVYVLSIHKENHFQDEIVDFQRSIGLRDSKYHKLYKDNLTYYIFYELTKFKEQNIKVSEIISDEEKLKIQWLDFLSNCSTRKEMPDDVPKEIQEAYNPMIIQKWTDSSKIDNYKCSTRKSIIFSKKPNLYNVKSSIIQNLLTMKSLMDITNKNIVKKSVNFLNQSNKVFNEVYDYVRNHRDSDLDTIITELSLLVRCRNFKTK
jgi:hypothetical protein